MAVSVGWSLSWAVRLATYAQPEAEAQVRKLEEKNVWLFTTLPTLGWQTGGEEDNKSETLACHF